MFFDHPIWLILALPLAAGFWLWRPRQRPVRRLRVAVLALVVLAMAGPVIRYSSRHGTVVVVADRSLSMPEDASALQGEAAQMLSGAMDPADRLAVVGFGRKAAVERRPSAGRFDAFSTQVDRDASNLAEALETALGLVPRGSPGRLLVIADGRWTGDDPSRVAARAAARGIALDFRLLERPTAGDLAIDRIVAPPTVTPGEAMLLTAWIASPERREVNFEILRDGEVIARDTAAVNPGRTPLTFRDRAGKAGSHRYVVRIETGPNDPTPENNRARRLVAIRGPKPVVVVSPHGRSGLADLLEAGGLDIRRSRPDRFDWSLDALAGASAVVLENVPANRIGAGLDTLAAWVPQTGSGLMITGGKTSYGPGGYYKSSLDPIMPVSMELRREHRKFAMAIVVALDRSGSMAMPVGGGKTKMDLADLAAAEVAGMLSPMDELGVLAVDSAAHTVVPLQRLENPGKVKSKILSIESMGGGIYVYEALSHAAAMLAKSKAGVRHIILFADAADAEQPGRYKELIQKFHGQITVSVIGLGTPKDSDAGLLRDIAKRGGGRCFFTTRAQELPRLFAQDTIVIARSAFLDDPTSVRATGELAALTGRDFNLAATQVAGYNLCYLRDGARLAAVTRDDNTAPLIAAWPVGSGRVLCYTGEADGEHTGPIAGWPDVGALFTSLARWTAGSAGRLPNRMAVTQEVRRGVYRIRLHLDPRRERMPFDATPSVRVLEGTAAGRPTSSDLAMRWEDADTLACDLALDSRHTVLPTLDIPGHRPVTLAPACLPYSPEFRPTDSTEGRRTLEQLARATGGVERIELPAIWNDLPERPRHSRLAPWLATLAVTLLLVEVFARRVGLAALAPLWSRAAAPVRSIGATLVGFGRGGLGAIAKRNRPGSKPRPGRSSAPATPADPEDASLPDTEAPDTETLHPGARSTPTAGKKPPPPKQDIGDALTQARRRADDRTRR